MSTQMVAPKQGSLNMLNKPSRKRSVNIDSYSSSDEPQAKLAHLEEPSPCTDEYIELPTIETTSEELSEPSVESISIFAKEDSTYVSSLAKEIGYRGAKCLIYDENNIKPGFVFPGTSIEVTAILGRGAFGKVVETNFNGSRKAIKMVKNETVRQKARNKNEARIMSTIASLDKEDSFVGYFESFEHGLSMCFVMEKMDLDLHAYMKHNKFEPLPADTVIYQAIQIFDGLSKLYDLGYVHADIKPNNILLVNTEGAEDPWRIKIADFGNSIQSSDIERVTNIQTPIYRCPEIHLALPGNPTVDTWSVGATVFFLYTGANMFTGRNTQEILKQIHENTPLWFLTEEQEASLLAVEVPERIYTERGFDRMLEYGFNFINEGQASTDDVQVVQLMVKIMQPDQENRPTPKEAFEYLMDQQE